MSKLDGIDELRACVDWADSRPENEHNGMTLEAILLRFRKWDPDVDPYIVARRVCADDHDYEQLLDENGEVLAERERAPGDVEPPPLDRDGNPRVEPYRTPRAH